MPGAVIGAGPVRGEPSLTPQLPALAAKNSCRGDMAIMCHFIDDRLSR